MRVFRGVPKSSDAPLALTIGNFDGVHRGHQAMLTRLIEGAEDLRLVPAVLTFEPHPREFFSPDTAPARLSTLRTKLDAFRAFGVATTVIARFDARLASLSAEAFIHDVLEKGLNARWVLVGDDFRFGKRRGGERSPPPSPTACRRRRSAPASPITTAIVASVCRRTSFRRSVISSAPTRMSASTSPESSTPNGPPANLASSRRDTSRSSRRT